ncbi:thioredoxin [Marivirga arenosa]|jgi:thioredoxin 1|uniref:Thioredoxin n=1 Tax=Marivirga arenosa TaxID=3059076 RepID=A0AA51ZVG1_9BACT|nr:MULTISPECIES: thioredoxin [unclassified Marivirga]WMN06200.1 thioredoxin [Marivirga sp. ABR2-2]WNB17476.1 thioredoxin [Marivirga sp. BKB1-2]
MASFGDLIKSETPVLVDFYADWCGPCKMMAPYLEEVAQKMKGKVKVIKVDVDRNQQASMKYQVQSIPTLILFQNGQIKWRQAGVVDPNTIMNQINQVAK